MKRFILLSAPRSGSTYIKELLNSHPNIRCWGEIFLRKSTTPGNFTNYCNSNPFYRVNFFIFGNRIASRFPYNLFIKNLQQGFLKWFYSYGDSAIEQAVGFKLMYGQFYNYQKKWVQKNILSVVHLIRKNALKKHLSALTKKKRGFAHSTTSVKPIQVYCDPQSIVKVLDDIVRYQERISNWLKDLNYIEIEYESFLYEYPKPYNETLKFLGVKEWA